MILGPQQSRHYVIAQVVPFDSQGNTAEVTTDHFGLKALAHLQSERALSF